MNKERVAYLHQQYVLNQMSLSELEEWKSVVGDPSSDEEVKLVMDEYWTSLDVDNLVFLPKTKSDALYQSVIEQASKRKKPYLAWIASAAAVLLIAGCLVLFNTTDDSAYITAGKNTASLTLPNGKAIILSDTKSGLVIAASKLAYDDGTAIPTDQALSDNTKTAMLTVITPRGGTYEVILGDGTHVWLNADSKLEFPNKFDLNERVVKLSGEGYFEVAKNKRAPFKVLSKGQQVEVLGTHFNVSAYNDEKITKTTLLEGAVKVADQYTEKVLTPGFQALHNGIQITVQKVDVSTAVAWKNKQFLFEHEDIRAIMKKVERWYDVKVIYDGEISDETFSGGVSRFDNLSEVLKSLESTGNVSFSVKGRIVYVSK